MRALCWHAINEIMNMLALGRSPKAQSHPPEMHEGLIAQECFTWFPKSLEHQCLSAVLCWTGRTQSGCQSFVFFLLIMATCCGNQIRANNVSKCGCTAPEVGAACRFRS